MAVEDGLRIDFPSHRNDTGYAGWNDPPRLTNLGWNNPPSSWKSLHCLVFHLINSQHLLSGP